MKRIFATDPSLVPLAQRLVLALVIGAHGAQKLLGWFGGWGLGGTLRWFTQDMGVPAGLALLIVLGESLGMIALAAGFLTRFMGAVATASMVGAIALVHGPNGFFMNWAGTAPGEGYELHLLALALSIPLIFTGGGAWSLDRAIARRLGAPAPARLAPSAA
jgi:putative oxidoreductase